MIRTMLLASICFGSCLAQQSRIGFGGVITGNLAGEDGTAIAGKYISVHLLPPYPKARVLKTRWSALSDAGGSFRVEDLKEGKYRLCVDVTDTTWLNPCEWDIKSAPVTTVSAAGSTLSVSIVLKKGVVVPIRIDDPSQFLARNENRTPGAHLLLGVPNEARVFRSAPTVSQDGSGRNYQIVVPFNYAIELVVHSPFFRLSDATGTPLPARTTQIPVLVPSGVEPAPIRLKITGGN